MNRQTFLQAATKSGALRFVQRYWGPDSLTVLAYHRIVEQTADFDTFAPNISATPADFAQQMAFLARHFNVVSMEAVADWLRNGRSLPPYPALITFDDGYRDNLTHALPILQHHNLPATIFLATGYIGKKRPFFWDLAAYCFHHTTATQATLPLLGRQQWHSKAEKEGVMLAWLNQLKQINDDEKWTAVKQLPALLNITVQGDPFGNLCLNWDEVRQMQQHNIHMGAHTHTHPILTRLDPARAADEIATSKRLIEEKTGQPVISFAYPNGQPTDYAPQHAAQLKTAVIPLAFTLEPSPNRPAELRQAPHTIRRILIDRHDNFPRFAAKVMGLTRLAGLPK